MDKKNNLVILYDYYSNLLTDKQKSIFEDYYFNNFSLSEISEYKEISRNAVHKQLKIIEDKLIDYENKLELSTKGKKIDIIKNIIKDEKIIKLIEEIE